VVRVYVEWGEEQEDTVEEEDLDQKIISFFLPLTFQFHILNGSD